MNTENLEMIRKLTAQLRKSNIVLQRTTERLAQQDEIIGNLIETIKEIAYKNNNLEKGAAIELTRGSLKQCHN
jgi:hypothetical protein